MRIALVTDNWIDEVTVGQDGSLQDPSSAEQPATLVLGDQRGWWKAIEVLPEDDRALIQGTAADALRVIRCWDRLKPTIQLPESQPTIDLNDWKLLPPVVAPQKIICIGLNYADHASETGAQLPEIPVVFNKFPTTLRGHGQPICLPEISQKVDYEAELVVVIGKPGKNISAENALDHVFGYTCGHDVSGRDWQKGRPGGQWLLGKTFDSFAPLGPNIVTADELGAADDLAIQFKLNGQEMQSSSTKHFIFDVKFLISHLSKFCTLLPGDLIFTGTPSGVGMARDPAVFMQPGDKAEVEIAGIGTLANPVV